MQDFCFMLATYTLKNLETFIAIPSSLRILYPIIRLLEPDVLLVIDLAGLLANDLARGLTY